MDISFEDFLSLLRAKVECGDFEAQEALQGERLDFSPGTEGHKEALVAWNMIQEATKAWREEAMEALITLRREGRIVSGRPPLGFKYVGHRGKRRLVPDPKERRVMGLIVRLKLNGFSWEGIRRHLREQGIRTRADKFWSTSRIRRAFVAELRLRAEGEANGSSE